jgi:hypothetical protein
MGKVDDSHATSTELTLYRVSPRQGGLQRQKVGVDVGYAS